MSNNFSENEFLQNIIFDLYIDDFLDLYKEIKTEAELSTDNLLSNDYIGFKNISSTFLNLIKNNIVINYEINENVEDSDGEDNINLDIF